MRTLVYKRTHKGDPDETGCFGIYDCMGDIRSWDFEAVIGIGGMGPEAKSEGIDRKINWIGTGARRTPSSCGPSRPLITFDHFILWDAEGEELRDTAPSLAGRMYSPHAPRFVLYGFNGLELKEISRLLAMAKNARPSTKSARHYRADAKCRSCSSSSGKSNALRESGTKCR